MNVEPFRQESSRDAELYCFPIERAGRIAPRVEIEPVWKRGRIRLLLIRLVQSDQQWEIELECNSRGLMISPDIGNVLHRWNRMNGESYFSIPWKESRLRVLLTTSCIMVD